MLCITSAVFRNNKYVTVLHMHYEVFFYAGFLWQLLCELASLNGNAQRDSSVQTDDLKLPPISSLGKYFPQFEQQVHAGFDLMHQILPSVNLGPFHPIQDGASFQRNISSLLMLGNCFNVSVLGQGISPSHASLTLEYLVGQRW